ncbi:MAG: hypothetical protein ABIH23_12225 [bacterium]
MVTVTPLYQLMRILSLAGFIAACCPSQSLADTATGTKTFRAGAAKISITPRLGISLAGHMQDRNATHIHDELHVRCLVLDNGDTRIAIAVCDLLALGKEPISRAKQMIQERAGLSPDHILIAATHTHTGPTTVPAFQSDPDLEYIDWLVVKIADCVQLAVNNLRPARVGWGLGWEDRVVFNRRFFMKPGTTPANPWGQTTDRVKMNPGYKNENVEKPAGPVDPDLPIVALQDLDGDPIAVLSNYTLHYVGGRSSDVSADYFGMWAAILERKFEKPEINPKPPFIAILTNGCSGDINNIDIHRRMEQPHPYHQMATVAQLVADDALHVLKNIEYHEWVPLDIREKTLQLGVRKPSPQDVSDARLILDQAGSDLKSLSEFYARETVLLADWEEHIQTSVQALRIGDVGIATFPGEAFVELGLETKKNSPLPLTFCIELANDYRGYIPTLEAHKMGGYETWRARSSFLEPTAAQTMVSTVLDLLNQVAHSGNDK